MKWNMPHVSDFPKCEYWGLCRLLDSQRGVVSLSPSCIQVPLDVVHHIFVSKPHEWNSIMGMVGSVWWRRIKPWMEVTFSKVCHLVACAMHASE
jgi:hypothetical protein